MASFGSSSQGLGGKRRKSVGEEFVDHRELRRDHFRDPHALPRPLNMEEYVKDNPPCQITHCTTVAVEQYNSQQGINMPKLVRAVGVDSNMFILDKDDRESYWHVYFKGHVGKEKLKFFAELVGLKGPERLLGCKVVDKEKGASVLNCEYCFGGIWHPPGDFVGCKSRGGSVSTSQ